MLKTLFADGWMYQGKPVSLPHDAMLASPRSKDAPSGGGCAYFEGGIYTYEKSFIAPENWREKNMLLQFEGVYRNTRVYLNGEEAGGADYGYIPFFVPLQNLKYGQENTIRVVSDNTEQPGSRWYSGGGIYRPVWLWECEKGGLTPECVKITTLSYAPARIRVESVQNAVIEIFDGNQVIATGSGQAAEFEIADARLWSDENPYLYRCRVSCGTDVTEDTFGIRKIEWSNRGLFVNGKETLLRGGCVHHDQGVIGAATYTESEWRRVRMLKEAGYNALRMSHNPASDAMLAACDYYGMYVMDEAWDMWYNRKTRFDYGKNFMANYREDLAAMVHRDYNHPSVLLYSIGNEISEPASERGVKLAGEMVALIHELDSTRPVTAGMNLTIISRAAGGKSVFKEDGSGRDESNEDRMKGMNSLVFNMITNAVGSSMNKCANSKKADRVTSPVLDLLDIAGYNYASGRYPLEGKAHPDRVIFGSETFPQDLPKNWGMVKKYPYLVGDFMWTAWDYIGETGSGAWAYSSDGKGFQKPYPWLLADMGAMDILGNPNGELFLAQAVWNLLKAPKIAVRPVNMSHIRPAKSSWRGTDAIPSWSFSGCEGKKAVVEVYFDCARIELYLNGKRIGAKKPNGCRAVFRTNYAPGKLEAVSFNAEGKELGRATLETAKETAIQIQPERREVCGGSLIYVPITLGDGRNVESNADRRLTVQVTGGKLLGFGSANPRTEESFLTGSYTTYYGRALAVVQTMEDKVTVTVSDGADRAELHIPLREN